MCGINYKSTQERSNYLLDNAFNRGRTTDIERQDRPRTLMRRWNIQQRVIK